MKIQMNDEILDATAEDIESIEKIQKNAEAYILELAKKDAAKESAINKLIDLGLTEDEAKAFLG
jgi:hypothetical protein